MGAVDLMPMAAMADNAATLERELEWAAALIDARIRLYFGQECAVADVRDIAPPAIRDDRSTYAGVLREHGLDFEERLMLILALIPQLRPQLLDPFLMRNANLERGFTEFGGIVAGNHGGFWPTLETAAFILCGTDLAARIALQNLFGPDQSLRRHKLIELGDGQETHGLFGNALRVGREQISRMTTGARHQPGFSNYFPAKRLQTPMDWEDLVLEQSVFDDVQEIRAWIQHAPALLRDWHLERKIKPGFRSLFYGPPGTGKTLTAALLGKSTGLDVYRVDLSLVVSKYIGETEKNLGNVFDQAENHNWILFFDEADALFGKRTQTSSSNDRYANQEVAYLLQRLEDFPGIVILATNLKGNIDEAFSRRFQSMIYFAMPRPEQRRQLWSKAFSSVLLEPGVDWRSIADEFELAGGAIINVLRYASLMALRRGVDTVSLHDIRQGIRREFRKDGKVV